MARRPSEGSILGWRRCPGPCEGLCSRATDRAQVLFPPVVSRCPLGDPGPAPPPEVGAQTLPGTHGTGTGPAGDKGTPLAMARTAPLPLPPGPAQALCCHGPQPAPGQGAAPSRLAVADSSGRLCLLSPKQQPLGVPAGSRGRRHCWRPTPGQTCKNQQDNARTLRCQSTRGQPLPPRARAPLRLQSWGDAASEAWEAARGLGRQRLASTGHQWPQEAASWGPVLGTARTQGHQQRPLPFLSSSRGQT